MAAPNPEEASAPRPPLPKEANFRSQYYGKVGFKGMDEKKALEQMLSQDPINLENLSNFALKCSAMPGPNRLTVWKFLLGVLNRYGSNRDEGWEWRCRSFKDCLSSVIQLMPAEQSRNDALVFLWMIVDGKMRVPDWITNPVMEEESRNFRSILQFMLTICDSEIGAYHLSREIHKRLRLKEDVIEDHVKFCMKMTLTENPDLQHHLESIGLHVEDHPLRTWLKDAFTSVFRTPALCKILDKVIAGSTKILVYLAVVHMDYKTSSLLQCSNSIDAVLNLSGISEEAENSIVQSALDRWAQDGRPVSQHHQQQQSGQKQTENNATSLGSAGGILPPAATADNPTHHVQQQPFGGALESFANDVKMPTRIVMSEVIRLQ